MNNSAALPENFSVWVIVAGFCVGGLVFIFNLWTRFRREEADRRSGAWKIPKIILAALFLGYGAYGLVTGDAVIPLRHYHLHLRGMAALLFFLTGVCAAGFVAFDVLDRRATEENPRRYRWLMYIVGFLAWFFLGLSLALSFQRGVDSLT